jgi:hypothetical protein
VNNDHASVLCCAITVMAFGLLGCESAASPPETMASYSTLHAVLKTQAYGLDAVTSALQSLERGDTETAILKLQAEITAGLTSMHALLPELKPEERQSVEELIGEAEAYARARNLKVRKSLQE